MKNILFVILSALALISCKTKTVLSEPRNTPEKKASHQDFFESIQQPARFENLKITSKINADTGQFIPTIDGVFYLENNKKIWANFSFLFMTQARAMVTSSGVKAYEKINKTYIDSDFSYFNNLLKVSFLDYNSLQNLLLGKTFVPVNESDFSLSANPEGYILSSLNNIVFNKDGKKFEYKVRLEYSLQQDLQKVILEEINTKNVLEIGYEKFEQIGLQKLPKNVKIIIKGKKTDRILIENTKFEFLKMETPFSVPNNYTKTEIK